LTIVGYQPIAFELLPEKFTLTQLQHLYEVILNKKLDKRNFRKKMLAYDILKELDEKQKGVSYRAAKLYRFDKRKYAKHFNKELTFTKE
jgi:8-oxo-dGTP diphosphatase